ncbi:hypothetical protein PFISCL1PPCAC_25103 [Pristionchus fissidentatus]|uniref:non-specific serine/threonine protein kinase n=1 Tax=Pristionchus fissidentatus TaxID=1538716 RepID=A0AAV5WP72_9BILA|nr:hypothetical protein PFISCL1PPCAC_25103 [Pristionchus fissidentatus]
MGRRPSSLVVVLLYAALSLLPTLIDCTSDTVISGRCHQKCAVEFTKIAARIRNDRSVANEPLTNSTEFVFCKLGCLRVPGFDEHHHASFHRGRRIRTEIDDTATEFVGRSAPVVLKSVDFLCTHPSSSANSSRVNVSVALDVVPENNRLVDFHIEILSRQVEGAKEQVIHSSHIFSTLSSIPIELRDDTAEVQVRTSAYDSMGLVGNTVASRWWPVTSLRDAADVPLKLSLQRQVWHEERAAALLSIHWPDYRIPSCALRLKIAHADTTRSHEDVAVHLDETRTALAHKLHYEETYAIEVDDVGMTSSSSSVTTPSLLVITVDPCLKMVADPNMCPPPPVSSLSYKWNTTDTFVVSWSFDQPSEAALRRAASHHFLVTVSLQPKKRTRVQTTREVGEDAEEKEKRRLKEEEEEEGVSVCDEKINHIRKTYTAEVRSATFRLPPSSQQCAFSVEVMAVDARNRRSRGVTIDSRQAEMESWQQVETAGIEIALLWAVFIFMCVMGVAVSIMVLRHQQRSSTKKKQLKEREHHREILDSLYGRDTLGRYAPAPSAIHTFMTAPSPPLTEVPRGVYRVGRGWSGGENSNSCSKDASYASRLMADDGYAICELHDETAECQHNLSLFPLPHTDRSLCGVPVYSPDDYDMVELVGRGRFGDVYSARFIQSTTMTAVKHFTDSSDLQSEFAAARSLCPSRSPLFPALVGVVCPPDSLALSALIYEYCPGGDLRSFLLAVRDSLPHRSHLARSLRIVAPRIFCFLRATAASISDLHSRDVVHRDLSTRNVLLTVRWKDPLELSEGCEAKLADLGLCCRIDGEEGRRRLSLPWQSPQVRAGGRYTMEDDVWSFGCLLLEVSSLGLDPFSSWNGILPTMENGREVARYVETIGVGHAKIDAALSNRLRPLISECLSIDRSKRPSIRRIIDYLITLNNIGGTIQSSDLLYYSKDSQFV